MKRLFFLVITCFTFFALDVMATAEVSLEATLNTDKQAKTDSLETKINIHKVPKQYSFEFGYRNVFSVIDHAPVGAYTNSARHGYGFLFDYAWQLSGLNKKRPAVFISVPLGYTVVMADDAASKNISFLSYGWTVRHELARNKKVTPFVGYGLLLNTLKIQDTPGGVMGHQTQFDLGMNIKSKWKLRYFAKIEYSYASFPKLGVKERMHFQFADLRVGVRF